MIDSDFVEAVKNSNLRLVRIKLGNIIAIDPTLKTFTEMREYAEQYMSYLYEPHDGELNWEYAAWSKDYYIEQQAELSFNFSQERLNLLCSMAKKIYIVRLYNISEGGEWEIRNSYETAKDFFSIMIESIGEAIEGVGKWLKVVSHDIYDK